MFLTQKFLRIPDPATPVATLTPTGSSCGNCPPPLPPLEVVDR